jgi:hypothetical protein
MKIKLTPGALIQLELIAETRTNKTGFLFGMDIGKFTMIESLMPVNFDETTIDDIYAAVCIKMGDKIKGVFFNNQEPFPSQWFIEDIIMKVKFPDPEFYSYDYNLNFTRLPHDEED